ncbi:SIR2 family protein [Jannaschia seosinensis]|uniref:SIR2 family protein n=1 Tax=Jannaschia seosinensis TaxID=313367 RepID=UPI0009F9518D
MNYDPLLYAAFAGTAVLRGFSCLIDGFNQSFDPSNMKRYNNSKSAFYLHLHGSPLFYTNVRGEIKKHSTYDLSRHRGINTGHLVLSHFKHKPALISSSPLLSTYWDCLEEAMQETKSIILFGYSGADLHLNRLVSVSYNGNGDQVFVVERKQQGADREWEVKREIRWSDLLPGCRVKVVWLHKITDFHDWGVNLDA